jgi:A-kinase anchor protein 1
MALDSSRQIRAITFLGAGAALLVVFGYLLMKSERKKPKRKSSKTSLDEVDTTDMESSFNLAIQASKNKQKDLELSKSMKLNSNLNKTVLPDPDHVVPDLETTTQPSPSPSPSPSPVNNNMLPPIEYLSSSSPSNKFVQQILSNEQHDVTDKLSETSSDSGQGQTDQNESIIAGQTDFDITSEYGAILDSSTHDTSNFSETKETFVFSLTNECKNEQTDKSPSCKQVNNNEIVPVKEITDIKSKSTETVTKKKPSKNSKQANTTETVSAKQQQQQQKKEPNVTKTKLDKKEIESNDTTSPKEVSSSSSPVSLLPSYEDLVAYEFNFPRKLCGKLIGKNGIHVDHIRSKTQTQIGVRNDPNSEELQIVCVSGRLKDVDRALDIVSLRFPAKLFPQISFKPISKPIVYRRYNPEKNNLFNETKILVAPSMFVEITSLLQNTNLDEKKKKNSNEEEVAVNRSRSVIDLNKKVNVHVTAVVSAAHVFIQLPTHPTYESLQKLDENMSLLYNSLIGDDMPLMAEPIEYGSLCVAPTSYGWHRAMITNYRSLEEMSQQMSDYSESCGLATIKFLDYGGYLTLPCNHLRQLRSDFMNLPFQAVECYLDGVYPYPETEEEGKNFLSDSIKNSTLNATITDIAEDGIPLIKLFSTNEDYENCNINEKIIKVGLAYGENEFKFDNSSVEDQNSYSATVQKGQNELFDKATAKNKF